MMGPSAAGAGAATASGAAAAGSSPALAARLASRLEERFAIMTGDGGVAARRRPPVEQGGRKTIAEDGSSSMPAAASTRPRGFIMANSYKSKSSLVYIVPMQTLESCSSRYVCGCLLFRGVSSCPSGACRRRRRRRRGECADGQRACSSFYQCVAHAPSKKTHASSEGNLAKDVAARLGSGSTPGAPPCPPPTQ